MAEAPSITLYRMKTPDHECPFGLRAKAMLDQAGYQVDERLLETRAAVDAFKAEQGVATTPQVFVNGERIGGSEDLATYLGQ